jgi:hypothetical protein
VGGGDATAEHGAALVANGGHDASLQLALNASMSPFVRVIYRNLIVPSIVTPLSPYIRLPT